MGRPSMLIISVLLGAVMVVAPSSGASARLRAVAVGDDRAVAKAGEGCGGDCGGASRGICGSENKCLCISPFFGNQCEKTEGQLVCVPNCENGAHCDPTTGKCECKQGFVGPACEYKCPTAGVGNDAAVCSGHGQCGTMKKTAECFCMPGWTGKMCSRRVCPSTDRGECNDAGRCVNGTCQCIDTFAGPSCAARTCNVDCNGHGKCELSTETCRCESGWFGKNCQFKACPKTRFGVCSSHGTCDETTGECACDGPWKGGACHIPRCNAGMEVDCSGHGRCRADKCHCAIGWAGKACERRECPMGCLAAAGRGECINSKCLCAPGYVGEACESKEIVPLECGVRCLRGCESLPLADDSDAHCHSVSPPPIRPDGSFAPLSTSKDKEDPSSISASNFPGFKCFQKCQAHCISGCFAQMEPVRSKQHRISAVALAAEVNDFAKAAEERAPSSTGGADASASGSASSAKKHMASFLHDMAERESKIAEEAKETDSMASENVGVESEDDRIKRIASEMSDWEKDACDEMLRGHATEMPENCKAHAQLLGLHSGAKARAKCIDDYSKCLMRHDTTHKDCEDARSQCMKVDA